MRVFVLTDEWVQDFEHGMSVMVFDTITKAQAELKKRVAEIKEWCVFDEEVSDPNGFEGWKTGEWNEWHTQITIEGKEVQ